MADFKQTGLLAVYMGGTKIAASKNAELSFSKALEDATTKDSGNYADKCAGLRDATWTADGLLVDANEAALFAAFDSDDVVAITFTSNVSTESVYTFDSYVDSLSYSSPETKKIATFSIGGAQTGGVVKSAVA